MPQLHHAWPILVPLAFTLATCVLGTLTRHQKHERTTHDLIRETRRRRQDYVAALSERAASEDAKVVEPAQAA